MKENVVTEAMKDTAWIVGTAIEVATKPASWALKKTEGTRRMATWDFMHRVVPWTRKFQPPLRLGW
jgi:hypothetical protein